MRGRLRCVWFSCRISPLIGRRPCCCRDLHYFITVYSLLSWRQRYSPFTPLCLFAMTAETLSVAYPTEGDRTASRALDEVRIAVCSRFSDS